MQPERSTGFLIDEVGAIEMVDVVSVNETVDAVCGGYVQVLWLFVVLEEPVPSFAQIGKKIPVAYGMFKAEIVCACCLISIFKYFSILINKLLQIKIFNLNIMSSIK